MRQTREVIDALRRRTTFVFDTAGQQIATMKALGILTTSVFDNAGQTIAAIRGMGNRVTVSYDAAGRCGGAGRRDGSNGHNSTLDVYTYTLSYVCHFCVIDLSISK